MGAYDDADDDDDDDDSSFIRERYKIRSLVEVRQIAPKSCKGQAFHTDRWTTYGTSAGYSDDEINKEAMWRM